MKRAASGARAKGLAITALLALGGASAARAIDGVLEINQACAAGPGCFSGDSPAFPVQIGAPGSYRLTSNLFAPDQSTSLVSITASGVTLDLNGFRMSGTNAFNGPGSACSAPGSGMAVTSSTTANGTAVANGTVMGMGSHGVFLQGANSSVDRLISDSNCGIGIRIGAAALVSNSIVWRNASDGINVAQNSRVSHSIAALNGASGITYNGISTSPLTAHGCVSFRNGVDGIFGGTRSRVSGSLTFSNADDGIAALGSGQVVENLIYSNTDRGITVLGGAGSGDASGVGLNVINFNTGLDLSGGTAIGCNILSGSAPVCPP
jgi:hypothetical protein